MLQSELLKEILAQRWLGHFNRPWLLPSQPMEVGQVDVHVLDELYLLIQEVVFQEITEMRGCMSRTQGMKTQGSLVRVLLRGQGSFHCRLGFAAPLILRWPLHILEESTALDGSAT